LSNKIKIALIFNKEFKFLLPDYRDNTLYFFFKHAINRNPKLEIEFFESKNKFDTKILEKKFDVIILPDNRLPHIPVELSGLNQIKIPVISRTGDPHTIKKYGRLKIHESHKIKYYFGPMTSEYFHKFYPKEIKFKFILAGLESKLYSSVKPFNERISNKILNTGNVGNIKLKSRLANAIINPKKSTWHFYKLRTMCNQLPYVDYSGMKGGSYIHKDYPSYISSYKASIAASTYYAVIKHLELTAAGCLTFMEVSDINNDAEILGFKDYENAIFINENNYEEKFEEFLSNPNDSQWEKIANNGREHTLKNLNNDKAAESLLELIEEVI
jgi:hypothetical protein